MFAKIIRILILLNAFLALNIYANAQECVEIGDSIRCIGEYEGEDTTFFKWSYSELKYPIEFKIIEARDSGKNCFRLYCKTPEYGWANLRLHHILQQTDDSININFPGVRIHVRHFIQLPMGRPMLKLI